MVLVGDTTIPCVTEDENTIHVNLPDYIISVPKEFPLTDEETNQLVEGMASALDETIQESLTKLGKKKIHLMDLNNNSLNPDACMSLKPENLKASVMGNGESNSMGLQGIPPDFEEYQRKILLEVFDRIQRNAKARLAGTKNAENVQPKMAMIVAKKKDSKKSKKARDLKVAQPEKKSTQPEKTVTQPAEVVALQEKNVDHPEKKVTQSDMNVNQPEVKITQPVKIVNEPEKKMDQSEKKISQPEKNPEQLEKMVTQLDKNVNQPEVKITQPVKIVNEPEKQMVPSEKEASQPEKKAEQLEKMVTQVDKNVIQPEVKITQPLKIVNEPEKQMVHLEKKICLPEKKVEQSEKKITHVDIINHLAKMLTQPVKIVRQPEKRRIQPVKILHYPEGKVEPQVKDVIQLERKVDQPLAKLTQNEKKMEQPEKTVDEKEKKNEHTENKKRKRNTRVIAAEVPKSATPIGNNNAAGDSSNKPQESSAFMTSQEGAEPNNDKSPQNPEVAAKPQEKTPQLIAELGEEKTILKTRAQKLVREAQLKLAELDEGFDDVCTMREIEEHLRNIQQQIKIIRIENRDLMKFCIASSARFDLETDYPSELPPPPPPRPPPQATPPDESRLDSSSSYTPFIERSYSI
ncbi:hypothetical protein Q1695_001538 [Nippostrongylus brasiliensis]|nr:hypothetical protein Q1695_001538 [Nippostrongylus brasiliensis]